MTEFRGDFPPLEEIIKFSLPKKGPYEVEIKPDYGITISYIDGGCRTGVGVPWKILFNKLGVNPQ